MKRLQVLALLALVTCLTPAATLSQDTTGEPGEATEAPTPLTAPAEEAPVGPGREILIGARIAGTLSDDTPAALYSFVAQAGDIVAITMESNDVDAYLRLNNDRGEQLLFDDDSGNDLDARIGPTRLPENGAYTIVATSFENVVSDGVEIEAGAFTLALAEYEPEPLRYPAEITGTLERGEVLRLYSFDGSAGDVLRISLSSDDFDPLLTLTEADNIDAPTIRDDDGGPNLNALIAPYIVPASGTYLLTAISYRTDSGGDHTLAIETLEPEAVAYGDSVTLSLSREEQPAGVFNFEAAAGDTVDIVVESPSELDTVLTVIGPSGAQVAFNDDATGRNPAVTGLELADAGTYTFVVQPFTRDNSGEVTVRLGRAGDEQLDVDETPEATEAP